MEIYISKGESLTIFATAIDGEKKTFRISHAEMMARGAKLTDGLTESEIQALQSRKKILAIKLYWGRTQEPLKDCKRKVEEWVERNQCCSEWPYCTHMKCIEALDTKLLTLKTEELMLHWQYAGVILAEQCRAFMQLKGCPVSLFGFFSYSVEDGITSWYTNANSNDNNTDDSD